MGFTYFNPVKDFYKGLTQSLKPPKFTTPAPGLPLPQPNPNLLSAYGNPPQFYQIKKDDTYQKIAQQYGMNPDHIQQLNGVVPPPKGSFIELPQNPAVLRHTQLMSGVVPPPKLPQNPALVYTQTVSPTVVPANYDGTPAWGAGSADRFDYANLTAVQNQLAAGNDPNVISASVASQLINAGKFTQKDLLSNGYIRNANGDYIKNMQAGNQGQPQMPNPLNTDYSQTAAAQYYAANNTPFYQQKRWYNGKYHTIGELVQKGILDERTGRIRRPRKRGGGEPPPEPVIGAGSTPSTVLNLHLGGG